MSGKSLLKVVWNEKRKYYTAGTQLGYMFKVGVCVGLPRSEYMYIIVSWQAAITWHVLFHG